MQALSLLGFLSWWAGFIGSPECKIPVIAAPTVSSRLGLCPDGNGLYASLSTKHDPIGLVACNDNLIFIGLSENNVVELGSVDELQITLQE